MFTVKQIYCIKHFRLYTKHFYKIKDMSNQGVPKFEVEISKMEAPIRFHCAIPKIATRCHLHSIECLFFILYVFSCNKRIHFCHNITSITKQLC